MAKTDTRQVVKENTTTGTSDAKPLKARTPVERLTLPSDGKKVQWAQVRESRYDELRAQLSPLPTWLVPASSAAAPAADASALNMALAGSLYDVLAQVESLIAVRAFGCSMDVALRALMFTPDEKKALAEPTARVLDKYLPASVMEKYGDEVMLALLLVTMTKNKIGTLQEHVAASRRAQRGPAPVLPIGDRETTGHAQETDASQDSKL